MTGFTSTIRCELLDMLTPTCHLPLFILATVYMLYAYYIHRTSTESLGILNWLSCTYGLLGWLSAWIQEVQLLSLNQELPRKLDKEQVSGQWWTAASMKSLLAVSFEDCCIIPLLLTPHLLPSTNTPTLLLPLILTNILCHCLIIFHDWSSVFKI